MYTEEYNRGMVYRGIYQINMVVRSSESPQDLIHKYSIDVYIYIYRYLYVTRVPGASALG